MFEIQTQLGFWTGCHCMVFRLLFVSEIGTKARLYNINVFTLPQAMLKSTFTSTYPSTHRTFLLFNLISIQFGCKS